MRCAPFIVGSFSNCKDARDAQAIFLLSRAFCALQKTFYSHAVLHRWVLPIYHSCIYGDWCLTRHAPALQHRFPVDNPDTAIKQMVKGLWNWIWQVSTENACMTKILFVNNLSKKCLIWQITFMTNFSLSFSCSIEKVTNVWPENISNLSTFMGACLSN